MTEHIKARLNSQPLIDLRIELMRGGQPSRFEATLSPGATVQRGACRLEVGDYQTARDFNQFVVREVETLGDGRVRVTGSDLRADWQRPVRVDVNVPLDSGTGWHDGEPIAAQLAIERLFEASGLPRDSAPTLPAGTPTPVNVRAHTTLASGMDTLLAGVGLTVTVDDAGLVVILPSDTAPDIDTSRLLELRTSEPLLPARVNVVGGPALALTELSTWESVLPDDDGVVRPLSEVLADWGINELDARQACLSDGGFERLVPGTGTNAGSRLATLKRYAFRLFRAPGAKLPWLPVGGVREDGTFAPPRLEAATARPKGTAPSHPGSETVETTFAGSVEGFELDADEGLVYLPRPPYALAAPTGGTDDATLQDRRLLGDPSLTLHIATTSGRVPFSAEVSTDGDGDPVTLAADHLIAVYDDIGQMLNRDALRGAANTFAQSQVRSSLHRTAQLAGVCAALAGGSCERVLIQGGADGLTTTLEDRPATHAYITASTAPQHAKSHSSAPIPSGLHQPINAFRTGPLVLKARGETPEGESVLAVEALHRSPSTGALEIRHPGPLAFPFFVESNDAAKFGRWFFVAGVEVTDAGRLRVLADDNRHTEIPPEQLFEARHVLPQAMRGLMVSLGDRPQFADIGPLVSDSRTGATSSLIYDLDGKALSGRKRGGIQFLTVLALSPAHKLEGARDGGWVPALNLREGDTTNPELAGRGLFAEGGGRSLGRLTAKQQAGPILADANACTKHLYGTAVENGFYSESAGHISTDAFFKVPGDTIHDAPVKFYPEPFAGGVPPWPPFEAQIKYDGDERHPWNHKVREGRWKIQYRVPFWPEIPPTWKPPIGPPPAVPPPVDDPPAITVPRMAYARDDIRPAISDHNLWAPSFDWLPAPSARDTERESPFTGPSIKSEGWAAEPDPSLGGGCIYFPPGVAMPAAQSDSGTRQTFLALHPEVVLAIGHPDFESGRVHSGWELRLAPSGLHLELLPRDLDASIPPGMDRGLRVTGHLQLGPAGGDYASTQALRLGESNNEGIAFGSDTELYRESEATLRTDGDLEVGGKLTVEGLIDPTGLELTPRATNPGGTPANTLWLDGGDGARAKIGADRLAYTSELPALHATVIAYTGNGSSGKTVILSGIHRVHWLLITRQDSEPAAPIEATPGGDTGDVRIHNTNSGATNTTWLNLDAPGSGPQTLTMNTNDGALNASGVSYRIVIFGTPT